MIRYEMKVRLAQQVLAQIVPTLLGVMGVDLRDAPTEIGPGGYELHTNPSLHTHMSVSDERAQTVAAALGWVFRQKSLLIADLRDSHAGRTGYVIVDLGAGPLSPDRAQAFFACAAATHPALGEGYTAFDDDMLFLNLTDTHSPGGALDDNVFAVLLKRSAEIFDDRTCIHSHGRANARFVENRWEIAPDGDEYARLLGHHIEALAPLRAQHTDVVQEWIRNLGRAA